MMKNKLFTRKKAIVKQPVAQLQTAETPDGYGEFLKELKTRIRSAQIKAALSVNRELIALYWHIGKSIVERQGIERWGKAIVERLAADLRSEFPGVTGFSSGNIWRMRAFYLAWTDEVLAQPARELDGHNLPQVVAGIPWFHNVILVEKLNDPRERLWYARETIVNGWSRSMLIHWIESGLYARKGNAITNFETTLPTVQSDLAAEVIKDPYNFDFLTLRADAAERELEQGLVNHVQKFLVELGAGFAFVGRQVHIDIVDEDFYIDLLFYHLKLRCFVVIDLKARKFSPEYAGKMNFYLSAVDDLLRHPDDKPSIGIILCKSRNKVAAEYALRDIGKPIGISGYVTKLVESLPENLKGALPSTVELEAELSKVKTKGIGDGK
jgi:predicted nuclease of restriction endonuclease-like (RecB) superfamily